jgi:hypothetical protein
MTIFYFLLTIDYSVNLKEVLLVHDAGNSRVLYNLYEQDSQ